jgi:arsenate reductase (glutaredoxin)
VSFPETQIYFNPSCSKCIYALEYLKANGVDPVIIQYLENNPSFEELKSLLKKLNLKPLEIIRVNEPLFIEKFSNMTLTDDEWINVIVQYPILLQRPILVKGNEAVIGRSDTAIEKVV